MFSIAFASADAAATGNPFLSFVPIVVLILVFYVFILRPQQKKVKEESKMRSNLRIGDKIVTTAGIFGAVTQIEDDKNVVSIEIAKGVNVVVYKSSISEVLTPKEKTKEDGQKK